MSWFHRVLALIGQWKIATNMPTKRRWAGVAALDNKIYVTGGYGNNQNMSSVDCYDPDTNTWSQMANMNNARAGHSLVSLHGRLYAIGGGWGVDSWNIEVYDPDNNAWTLLQHRLDAEVFGTGATLLKKFMIM